MQEEKRSFLLLPDSFNCITPYDIMSLTDFINSAECVAGSREIYLLEPSEIDYEKARTKLIESIKKINQKYFPEGFFDYITGYDDFSCDMVFYPMVISKGELKSFRRNYSEYHTITTALYGKIDEFGRVDITPVTRKKKVEKHEYISPNVETASIQIHPSKGLEKMFTPERKPLKISDIKDDLGM